MAHDSQLPNNVDAVVSHRILDANLNRAFEAIRTLEDIARFGDMAALQAVYKELRHRLRTASRPWSQAQLLASRNAEQDVGRERKVDSETVRPGGLRDIAGAATQRLQQALRCLEELAKSTYPDSAATIEAIRYKAYDANAQLMLSHDREVAFLRSAQLYVLADCQLPMEAFGQRIRDISHAGVDIIQIRDKQLDARDLIRYTCHAMECASSNTRIVVNDRADVARVSGAWGLHVGQTDLTLRQARPLLDPKSMVGLSTHDMGQVREAVELGADYIGCGPTFPSATKRFDSFAGLAFLTQVAEYIVGLQIDLPAFAIGGIELANIDALVDTGIRRIAVGRAIWGADHPTQSATEFRKRLTKTVHLA